METLLWIEDQAKDGALRKCTNQILRSKLYSLSILRDASSAEREMFSNRFDKVVFDLRIPPGSGKFWEEEFANKNLKLGLKLIERVISKLKLHGTQYGIVTIESWLNIRERALKIDSLFDYNKQYLCKDGLAYPEDILPFLKNL